MNDFMQFLMSMMQNGGLRQLLANFPQNQGYGYGYYRGYSANPPVTTPSTPPIPLRPQKAPPGPLGSGGSSHWQGGHFDRGNPVNQGSGGVYAYRPQSGSQAPNPQVQKPPASRPFYGNVMFR